MLSEIYRHLSISIAYMLLLFVALLPSVGLFAQVTQAESHFTRISSELSYFDHQQLYLPSVKHRDKSMYDEVHLYRTEIENSIKQCLAIVRHDQQSDQQCIDLAIRKYYPRYELIDILMTVADIKYVEKEYRDALNFYNLLSQYELSRAQYSEANFKKAYCHFVQQEFDEAIFYFDLVKEIKSDYYYPANYYFGMCLYFQQNYEGAISTFQKVGDAPQYRSYIPYYLTQIYFAEARYEELIRYAENALTKSRIQNILNIRLLLGQAYFELQKYDEALPHLEYYENNSEELTAEEFYQLAYTQYRLGNCDDAIDNFSQLVELDTQIGQLSNNYLADCFLKSGNKKSARTAFRKVSVMDFDSQLAKEAEYNYGKLSAELNFERDAINTLINIESSSPYYADSQKIISDILNRTSDYSNANKILRSIKRKSPELQATHQRVNLYQGIQYYKDKNYQKALSFLDSSTVYRQNAEFTLKSNFWIGKTYNNLEQVDQSIDALETVLENKSNPSIKALIKDAHYTQAYNFLKKSDYKTSQYHFNELAIIYEENGVSNLSDQDAKLYQDAMLRQGDCMYKLKQYSRALGKYEGALDYGNYMGDYVLYQKATLEGLSGKPYDKIISLEELVAQYPKSEYADQAYYDLGNTFMGLGNSEQAVTSFEKLVKTYKNRSDLTNNSYLKLGLLSYNQGDVQSALSYYKQVFDNNATSKESAEALLAIKEIYVDDLSTPRRYFDFIKELPGYELSDLEQDSLTYAVAWTKYQEADYNNAVLSFTQYLDNFEKGLYSLDAYYYRGESHSLLKNYNLALQDYGKIIDIDNGEYSKKALKKAAIISYNHAQDFKRALNYYSRLDTSHFDKSIKHEAQMGALQSAFRINDRNEITKYGRLIYDDPLSTVDERTIAAYYLGKVYYNRKDFDNAKAILKFVVNNSKNNKAAESSYLLSKISFDEGEFALAEEQCNNTNMNYGAYPDWVARSLILLSDIYVVKEDLFNAQAALEALIENFKSNEEILNTAQSKLEQVQAMAADQNRLKEQNTNGLIELDTTGNDR